MIGENFPTGWRGRHVEAEVARVLLCLIDANGLWESPLKILDGGLTTNAPTI